MTTFTDAKGWYPGLEYRPDLDPEDPLFFRDIDASTVVPSLGNEIYSTRIVDGDGKLKTDLFGLDIGSGQVTGTGNPADGRPAVDGGDPGTDADLSLGVLVQFIKSYGNNSKALVVIRPGHRYPQQDTGPLPAGRGPASCPGFEGRLRQDSNLRHLVPETSALSPELRRPAPTRRDSGDYLSKPPRRKPAPADRLDR